MKKILIRLLIICGVIIILLLILAFAFTDNTTIVTTEYKVKSEKLPEAFDGYRIVQVSDVHNGVFGEGNCELIDAVAVAEPDIIAITGDMIDSRCTDVEVSIHLGEALMDIAPVYYITGNHEHRVDEYFTLREGLEAAGVIVLENTAVKLELGGDAIAFVGIFDPTFYLGEDYTGVISAARGEVDEELFSVLLSHRPEMLERYSECGIDLTLTGHAHGGQVRLPIIGGLAAPGQGLFPQYDAGLFESGKSQMVVSRGLGNSLFPWRINNKPELVVAELVCTK